MRRAALSIALAIAVTGCASGETTGGGATGSNQTSGTTAVSNSGTTPAVLDFTKPLTVEACVRAAETSSPTARSFQARLDAARGAAETAATWPNPTVEYHIEDVGTVQDHQRQVLQQEIGSYPILAFVTKFLEADVGQAELKKSAAGIEDDRRKLRLEVGQAFYELLADDESVKNETEATEIALRLAQAAERRLKVGDVSALDEKRARTEALEAKRDLENAVKKRLVDAIAFALALGAEKPEPIVLETGWPKELPPDLAAAASSSATAIIERALAKRPDIAEAEAELDRAKKSVDLEDRRAVQLHQTVLAAGSGQGPEGIGAIIDVQVQLPLFDRNQGPRAKARAELEGAFADLERTRRAAAFEVEAALLTWVRTQRALDEFARPIAKAREDVLEATRRLFQAGEVSYLDLLQAQRDAVAARREVVDAEKETALARWKLIVATSLEPRATQ